MGTTVILNLVGGIALLLWGLHMVQSGILRAFGGDLRRLLGIALRNRFVALLTGIGATALLQSSTATALMTSTFVGDGLVGLVPALALMLGANVGTTLIVQIFSFDISAWSRRYCWRSASSPLKMRTDAHPRPRPRRDRPRADAAVAAHSAGYLGAGGITRPCSRRAGGDHRYADTEFVFGAVLAWAAHSSVAVVLLVISLAYSNFITPIVAFALVLGANLGSAINPLVEGGSLRNPVARRLPLGNLINRVVGCALVLPFLQPCRRFDEFIRHKPGADGRRLSLAVQHRPGRDLYLSAAAVRPAAAMAIASAGRQPRSVSADLSRPFGGGRRRRWR